MKLTFLLSFIKWCVRSGLCNMEQRSINKKKTFKNHYSLAKFVKLLFIATYQEGRGKWNLGEKGEKQEKDENMLYFLYHKYNWYNWFSSINTTVSSVIINTICINKYLSTNTIGSSCINEYNYIKCICFFMFSSYIMFINEYNYIKL